jgi:hypothetical protein
MPRRATIVCGFGGCGVGAGAALGQDLLECIEAIAPLHLLVLPGGDPGKPLGAAVTASSGEAVWRAELESLAEALREEGSYGK